MVSLPEKNADGRPLAPLTAEQKYLLDTRGWLLIPGVLASDEIAEMKAFCYRLRDEPQSIPEAHRSSIGGPLERLIDHPAVAGFMNEFVAYGSHATAHGYGFRCEGSFLSIRRAGDDNFAPHGGNGLYRFPGNSHTYHCYPGHANSALTRAVWELNPVRKGDGGTCFLTGSHKAVFPLPESLQARDSWLWEDYACPAGSLLFFTEAITHTGTRWNNAQTERVAVFNCYNAINAKWHRWEPHPEHLTQMPPLRRSLFRGVFSESNTVAQPTS